MNRLKELSEEASKKDLMDIATISAESKEDGEKIAEMVSQIGPEANTEIEPSQTGEHTSK